MPQVGATWPQNCVSASATLLLLGSRRFGLWATASWRESEREGAGHVATAPGPGTLAKSSCEHLRARLFHCHCVPQWRNWFRLPLCRHGRHPNVWHWKQYPSLSHSYSSYSAALPTPYLALAPAAGWGRCFICPIKCHICHGLLSARPPPTCRMQFF